MKNRCLFIFLFFINFAFSSCAQNPLPKSDTVHFIRFITVTPQSQTLYYYGYYMIPQGSKTCYYSYSSQELLDQSGFLKLAWNKSNIIPKDMSETYTDADFLVDANFVSLVEKKMNQDNRFIPSEKTIESQESKDNL